ncbi:MAG: heme biosynthesis HemY N-terminal domain-containing protein [Rhodoferax sp.]|nr:heme biosynthesis HemY N-terminal domain-containing protein [Rhodoferax sp.]
MRFALWLVGLFGCAVAIAWFAGSNEGTVTLYWPPYRVDVSLNLAALGLIALFAIVHTALRGISGLLRLPQQARRWRLSYKERTIYAGLLDAVSHLIAGRYGRARRAAEMLVQVEQSMAASADVLPDAQRVRILAHLLAAESAHSLQDRDRREMHFQHALAITKASDVGDLRDGVQLRAVRWALEDRDAMRALQWLDQLPVGTSRRTVALRLRFKAARMAGHVLEALEAARVLTKYRVFSEVAGAGIARGLALELLRSARDLAQLQAVWEQLDPAQQQSPDIAFEAAQAWIAMGGDSDVVRAWMLPLWERLGTHGALTQEQRTQLIRLLDRSFANTPTPPDSQWLARIEAAQMSQPGDPLLQYLAGVLCIRLALWGKAQALIRQALSMLKDDALKRRAWLHIADLAERHQDATAAAQAYQRAAKL